MKIKIETKIPADPNCYYCDGTGYMICRDPLVLTMKKKSASSNKCFCTMEKQREVSYEEFVGEISAFLKMWFKEDGLTPLEEKAAYLASAIIGRASK